jgi:TonB-dependent receptor
MGAKQSSFKRKLLASSISSCILATVSAGVSAQDGKAVDEVVVTGIRASLESAMDIKRDSGGVVDAISAEDIGKMPDTNLAESLQRITGVSINRNNGEGQNITVRGFGPSYNMVTLNGRTMPTAQTSGIGDATSRAFDFSNVASEAVGGIEVYKTGRADVATGGIGATVNVKTARPLDNPGFSMSMGGKAVADTTNRIGRDVTPELSGVMGWSDDAGKFGVLVSMSHQERDSASVGAYVSEWRTQAWNGPASVPQVWFTDKAQVNAMGNPVAPDSKPQDNEMGLNAMGVQQGTIFNNAPVAGQLYSLPADLRYTVSDRERTRQNGQLVLQFAPTDRITTTLDYTYAENESFEWRHEQSLWFDNYKDVVTFDDEVVKTPVLYAEDRRQNNPKDSSSANQIINVTNVLRSVGFNLDFEVTDKLSITLDAHDSSAESAPPASATYGSWVNTGYSANVVAEQSVDFRGDLPQLNYVFDDAYTVLVNGVPVPRLNDNGVLDGPDYGTSISDKYFSDQLTDASQIRLDGDLEFDNGAVKFGIESRVQESTSRSSLKRDTMGNWGIENPGEIPEEFFTPIDFRNEFDDYTTTLPHVGLRTNPVQLLNWAANKYGFNAVYDSNFAVNRTIEEDIVALYSQVRYSLELSEMPVNILAGVRYETTDTTSIAATVIRWEGNNDFRVINPADGEVNFLSYENDYNHLLPNLDLDIEFMDGVKGRLSFSQTIARPNFNELSATTAGFGVSGITSLTGNGNASRGNPALEPLESTNLDVSVEWYYADASYVSVGAFNKDVKNFIGNEPIQENWFGLTDASAGPRAQAARNFLTTNMLNSTDDSNIFKAVAAAENLAAYNTANNTNLSLIQFYNSQTYEWFEAAYDVIPNEDDPLYVWNTQTPVNSKEAKIHGFELAAQHFFGDTGFGLQANYTIVRGDIDFDVAADPSTTQFALLGLSDTFNLAGFYENDQFKARVTYNWRDKFLDNATRFRNEPSFTEAYAQIDFSTSYSLTEALEFSFEGLNVTGENYRTHGRSEAQLWNLSEFGARYNLGVRYTY